MKRGLERNTRTATTLLTQFIITKNIIIKINTQILIVSQASGDLEQVIDNYRKCTTWHRLNEYFVSQTIVPYLN
jgi:hypothetical protein